jgi:hypothetical protein
MKLLVAMLVLMIAAQPVQAGFCDMDLSGDSTSHADMQHRMDAENSAHDCCQSSHVGSDPGRDNGCSDMPCGTCVAGVQAISPAASLPALAPVGVYIDLHEGVITPSHSSPPFRPPIFIS